MTIDIRTLTQAELMAEAKSRFGNEPLDFAFQCPSCKDIATLRDFLTVRHEKRHRDGSECKGHPEAAGQECIGRYLGALAGAPTKDQGRTKASRGCDWCAFGFIPGPWTITFPDGHEARSFPLAPAQPGGGR